MNEIDLAEVATHGDLLTCLDRLYIRADSPSYRVLEQRSARLGGELPGTKLERVRLGRSAIGELLSGSTFPKKAFLLTFVEACGVDVTADRQWEQAWDRLSDRYAKRAGQARTKVAQLREEVAGLQAQLAAAAQDAEKARLEASHRLERAQQQLSDAQDEVARLREEVRELTEELTAQKREAARPRDLALAAADSPDHRAVPGYSRAGGSGYGAPPWVADPADRESPAATVPDPSAPYGTPDPSAPEYGSRGRGPGAGPSRVLRVRRRPAGLPGRVRCPAPPAGSHYGN